MQQWNEAFKKQGKIFLEAQGDLPEIARLFKQKGVKKVLDLGCGSGRHLVFLVKKGFMVFGFDIAKDGIILAKKWLKSEGLKPIDFKIGDIYQKLPYYDNFFDAIISTQTLHHNKIENIRKLIKEIERITKPQGLLFISVANPRTKKQLQAILKPGEKPWRMKKIAPCTLVPMEGDEKGLVHYIFSKTTLKKEFKNFKIHNIWIEPFGRHLCLLGELKR